MDEIDDSISVIVLGIVALFIAVYIIGHLPNFMQYILYPILGIVSMIVIVKFNGDRQFPSSTLNKAALASLDSAPQTAQVTKEQAQVAWAMQLLNGISDKVIVVPVFKYEPKRKQWLPTNTIVRQGSNKAFASLLLMGHPSGNNDYEHWQDKQYSRATGSSSYLVTCLSPMPVEEAKNYRAGQLLPGRIDTAYTFRPYNPNNINQGKWYISQAAADLDIPATDEAGNVYYQKRYWEDDLTYPTPTLPNVDFKKILDAIEGITGDRRKIA